MLLQVVNKYLELYPEERAKLRPLLAQIANNERLDDRKNRRGHVAVDGMVLSPDRTKLLMIYHNVAQQWQQPGGHWEPEDGSLLEGAEREVREETGLQSFSFVEWLEGNPLIPLDIDTHPIPARPEKNEGAHTHYSFAYVFHAKSTALQHQVEEVGGAKWFLISDVEHMHRWHFPRVITKLKQLDLI